MNYSVKIRKELAEQLESSGIDLSHEIEKNGVDQILNGKVSKMRLTEGITSHLQLEPGAPTPTGSEHRATNKER